MDYDDSEYTNVDAQRSNSGGGSGPRKTPRMLPAETVMPTVSYRTPVGPSAAPRTVTPRAASPTPSSALPTAAYRAPTAPPIRVAHTPPDGIPASAHGRAPASALPATHRTPPDGVRTGGAMLDASELFAVELPTTQHTATPPRAARPPMVPVRHVAPPVECEPELSVVEMMPRAPRTPAGPAITAPTTPRGELTVVFGCRGGAGSTTLAINTAAALARAGRSVCIVDLDLQLGDVCVALDLEPQTSLASVAREAHVLDGTSLRRRLAQHGSGVCALAQTGHVDDLDAGLAARLPILLDTLRAHFDHVIVDGIRDFGDIALAALEAATKILVVVTQDVPAVRRAARVLTLLSRLAIEESRCALVINRAARRATIDDTSIERALGIKIAARIREDAKVAEALDAGALLVDIAPSRSIVEDVARVATLCRGVA